jgi:hypothetical protein
MGMYSSPAPPPPPDYTNQRQSFVAGENARRQEEADKYNEQVNSFNDSLLNFGESFDSIGSRFQDIDLNNVNDFGDWRTDLQGLRNNVLRNDFEVAAPDMPSMISSYGEMVSLDTPNLMSVDNDYRNTLLNDIEGMFGQYEGLLDQRQDALSADSRFRNQMNTSLSNLWNTSSGTDIYRSGALDSLANRFGEIQNQFGGYQSKLDDASFGGVESGLNSFNDWLQEQRNTYSSEQGRVSDYRNTLQNSLMDFGQQFGDLTVNDLDQINALDEAVAMKAREAMNFNSPLNADFGASIAKFGNLDTQIDALRDKRTSEEKRINQAGKNFGLTIEEMLRKAPEVNLNSGSSFDNMRNQVEQLRRQMQGFDSPLEADFSAQLNDLTGIEEMLDSRFQERRNAIGDIVGNAQQARDAAMGLDLWDEQGMRGQLDDLNTQLMQLGQYTGGQVSQDRDQIQSLADSIRGRLGELDTYRGGIEGRAQDLLGQVEDTSFYGMEDVDKMQSLYDSLAQEQDQYGAMTAMDELDAISRMLGGNRDRIQTQLDEAAARAAREAQEAENTVFGMDRQFIEQQLANSNLTPEEYASLVQRVQEKDPEFAQQIIAQYGALFGG